MATITEISEAYVEDYARLDPVRAARGMGVGGDLHHVTDWSPEGHAARADLFRRTAAALARRNAAGSAGWPFRPRNDLR